MFDSHLFYAVADAPAGLIRSAIAQAGVTIGQFLSWLGTGDNAEVLVKIGVEFATGNETQAISDLVALLSTHPNS